MSGAHPDDEAYLSAALMARARQSGYRVVVVTATRGERGTPDPDRWPPPRLAVLRQRELELSLATVGVHEHHWLGLHDGTLAAVPADRVVDRLTRLVRDVRPDTIVTFGPEGMTGHSDHATVSRWTTAAWLAAGARARLWYATLTPRFHRTWGHVNERIGLWFPGSTPPCTDTSRLAAEVVCDRRLLAVKEAALRAHASQTEPLVDLLGRDRFRRWFARESFVAAQPPSPTFPER